jgi:hypothetical protein
MGFAASTKSLTPHVKKKNCTKKNKNPPTADFHLKRRKKRERIEEKRKKGREGRREDVGLQRRKKKKTWDLGMQTHGVGIVDPRPA